LDFFFDFDSEGFSDEDNIALDDRFFLLLPLPLLLLDLLPLPLFVTAGAHFART
jgi:hypothetical protein